MIDLRLHEIAARSRADMRAAAEDVREARVLIVVHPERAPASALGEAAGRAGRGRHRSRTR